MAYTPVHADWQPKPSTATPITDTALEHIEQGIVDAHVSADAALTELAGKANSTDLAAYQPIAGKNSANGYAGLDASGKVAAAQLPTPGSTDTITEGATNLYFTSPRAVAAVQPSLDSKAIVADNGTAAFGRTSSTVVGLAKGLLGYENAAFPLPGTASSLGINGAITPILVGVP